MWPVLLLGLVALASATRYAIRPERLCLRFVAVLWVTLVVAVVHATVTDLAAVFRYFEDPARAPDSRDRAHCCSSASRSRRARPRSGGSS